MWQIFQFATTLNHFLQKTSNVALDRALSHQHLRQQLLLRKQSVSVSIGLIGKL